MQLCDVFLALGGARFERLLRGVSMGKLKTYQLFDRIKTRAHLGKLNQENLRKSAPRLWSRIEAREEDLAADLAQAVLVSHLEMITAVLDFLGIPHNEGFFDKEADLASHVTEGWQQRAYDAFRERFEDAVLVFYLNHLARELSSEAGIFLPGEVS